MNHLIKYLLGSPFCKVRRRLNPERRPGCSLVYWTLFSVWTLRSRRSVFCFVLLFSVVLTWGPKYRKTSFWYPRNGGTYSTCLTSYSFVSMTLTVPISSQGPDVLDDNNLWYITPSFSVCHSHMRTGDRHASWTSSFLPHYSPLVEPPSDTFTSCLIKGTRPTQSL